MLPRSWLIPSGLRSRAYHRAGACARATTLIVLRNDAPPRSGAVGRMCTFCVSVTRSLIHHRGRSFGLLDLSLVSSLFGFGFLSGCMNSTRSYIIVSPSLSMFTLRFAISRPPHPPVLGRFHVPTVPPSSPHTYILAHRIINASASHHAQFASPSRGTLPSHIPHHAHTNTSRTR